MIKTRRFKELRKDKEKERERGREKVEEINNVKTEKGI